MDSLPGYFSPSARRLRLITLVRLRWLAVAGQSFAVFVVWWLFEFPFPVLLCLALIACSVWLNLFLTFRYPPNHRVANEAALGYLTFDVLQLAGLLYMTGGMSNPFAVLIIAPVIISATSLPVRETLILGGLALVAVVLLTLFHLPLPWTDGAELPIPALYVAGMGVAVISSLAFTAIYAWRVADEARQLAGALTATELVLQREQHISALDGLAAAAAHELGTPLATIALVAREMERDLPEDSPLREDVGLLRSQSQRCRDILRRLTSLQSEGDRHIAQLPLTSLVEEISEPHRGIDVDILPKPAARHGPEPVFRRNPGVIYGLGNLVENAADFAKGAVHIRWGWDIERVWIQVIDDGPGYPPDIIDRIGEPYTSTRANSDSASGGGLGLGLFIAKTLLERSGAQLVFANSPLEGFGASVTVSWQRKAIEYVESEAMAKA